jgi:peptidoglycan/LPS O-acetylase OafA/YrhL
MQAGIIVCDSLASRRPSANEVFDCIGGKVAEARESLAISTMRHVPQLDGLRAVAIVIVFIGHLKLVSAFPAGFGVTIFFFLSGFLITTLLRIEQANTGKISLKVFYWRRILRINPPLWLSMAFVAALCLSGLIDQPLDPFVVFGQAFFFVNYLPSMGQGDGLPIPLWSLAVEEHFYLLFPLCFGLAMQSMPARKLALWCAAACCAVLAIRLFNIYAIGEVERNYYWTHTRIDSILYGCILALWNNPLVERSAWKPRPWHVAGAMLLVLLTFAVRAPGFREGLRYSLQGMALFVLFSWTVQHKGWLSRILLLPVVQRLGLYSYTLYLVHYGIILAVYKNLPGLPVIAQVALAAALSMIIGALMYRLVERPLGRWRLNRAEATDRAGEPIFTEETRAS